MTAFPLFDLFAATTDPSIADMGTPERQGQLLTIAASMVANAVQQFQKIRALDEALAAPADLGSAAFDVDAAVAIRLMYEEAANDAERILNRIDRLERENKCVVSGSDELRDWHGETMAMLSISLEEIGSGIEQAKRGQFVTATELRYELHNRLHH